METELIMEVVPLLTWKSMSKIAIHYLGFEKEDLENIWAQQEHDVTRYIREVIRQWQKKGDKSDRSSKVQQVADILCHSGEVYPEDVKEKLKIDNINDTVKITKPKSRRKFSTRKIGQLADCITNRAMETIALKDLKVSFAKVDNKRYAGNGYWWFNITILVDYLKRKDSTPEKLRDILINSGEVDCHEIEEIFDEEDSSLETDEAGPINDEVEANTSGSGAGSVERNTQQQQMTTSVQKTDCDSTNGNPQPREPPVGQEADKIQEKKAASPILKTKSDPEEPFMSEIDGGVKA